MEFVKAEFSFSKEVTASLTLFFKYNSEIKDWFLISSFNLISTFNYFIFLCITLKHCIFLVNKKILFTEFEYQIISTINFVI